MSHGADAAWAARRALMEGASMTFERMAQACRVSAATLERTARQEGWRVWGVAKGLSRSERLARLRDRLLEKAERIELNPGEDEPGAEKAVSDLSTSVRTLLKIFETTRDEDDARERQMTSDARIADLLDRLDRKIVELARHLAEKMVGDGIHAAADLDDQRGVGGDRAG